GLLGYMPIYGSPSAVALKVPAQDISVTKGISGNIFLNFFSRIVAFLRNDLSRLSGLLKFSSSPPTIIRLSLVVRIYKYGVLVSQINALFFQMYFSSTGCETMAKVVSRSITFLGRNSPAS